jgi:threonine/homoserine/homoserine lactone efflux protein
MAGEASATTTLIAGFTLGLALAGAPGPVQAVLLAEALRAGIARGFEALVGANVTFAVLLGALALGVSLAAPSGWVLRVLQLVGGLFLVWLAVDGFRSAGEVEPTSNGRRRLPPVVRGGLAVILNPGAWLFLAVVASPLLASAESDGGTAAALLVAGALVVGVGLGDVGVVLLGGLGLRGAGPRVRLWILRGLALVLAGLGVWLLLQGALA